MKTVAAMFRESAALSLKHASNLEDLSTQIYDNNTSNSNYEQGVRGNTANNQIVAHHQHRNETCTSSSSSSQTKEFESPSDKLRREATVKLAKKSYEGAEKYGSLLEECSDHKYRHWDWHA